ncbi:MAG: hypothetical protein MZW92_37185 [Comamonadaceae bacterium]|nr:hypothetical protein [Comamonadaceae bacterium]
MPESTTQPKGHRNERSTVRSGQRQPRRAPRHILRRAARHRQSLRRHDLRVRARHHGAVPRELLGASATVVGVVAGLGELIGYALRLVSGRLADRSGRYWAVADVRLLPQSARRARSGPGRALAGRRWR